MGSQTTNPPWAWAAIGGVILALGGFMTDHPLIGPICLLLAGIAFVLSIRSHYEGRVVKQVLLSVAVMAGLGFIAWQVYARNIEKELKARDGTLVPAGEPMPLLWCGIPNGALAVILGREGATSWARTFPHTVVGAGDDGLLVIDRDPDNGQLLLSAKVFDERGDVVAKIEKNKFYATNAASHMERPDRSTLIVYDHRGDKVLSVRLPSQESVVITGVFRYGRKPPVVITDKAVLSGGLRQEHVCFGGFSKTLDISK